MKKIQERDAVLDKYAVASLSELSEKVDGIAEKTSEARDKEKDIQRLLASKTIEVYQAEADAIATDDDVVIPETLEDDIEDLLSRVKKEFT